jgi:predicted Zn-dependent peptidase
MEFKRFVLPNGLRLITIPMAGLESVTSLIMVHAGSRFETEKNSGISHFLEHMAFKGTEKRPSALDISSLIDGIGGEFNAFTGKETTAYYIKSAVSNFDLTLDILSDMLNHSKFDPTEIEKEKGVIIEEINMYEDLPMRKIGDVYENLLYGNTPMGWDIAGNKDVIMSVKRQDFVEYMASLYSADNMTVVIAGGIKSDKAEELVMKYFGEMKTYSTIKELPVVEKQDKPAFLVKPKKTEQVHMALGVRAVSVNDPKHYPLALLATILGGGMSSRLFHEIREKRGLAYYVRANTDEYVDCGTLVAMAGVDPKRAEEALRVLIEEFQKVGSGKMDITKAEVTKAKEYLKGHLVLDLEDSRSVAAYYAQQELLEEEMLNPSEVLKKIDEITQDEVESIGKEFFKEDGLNLAVIGNIAFEDKLTDMLKLS